MRSLREEPAIVRLFCFYSVTGIILSFLIIFCHSTGYGEDASAVHYSKFSGGFGPSCAAGVYRLLDSRSAEKQVNTIGFDLDQQGAFEELSLRANVLVSSVGDGGGVAFLNTAEYGERGPAPFLENWVSPNLRGTFAVGIDVHNPLSREVVVLPGKKRRMPEREVSLHWDGREIVKRVASVDFRDEFIHWEIAVQHVVGGAEITVRIAEELVYERYFIAGMLPYESRLAVGAVSQKPQPSRFELQNIIHLKSHPATPRRPPKHFMLFNHVMVNSSMTPYENEVILPPREWAFGRIILTLKIHDAGPLWDEWDRAGHLYVEDRDGVKRDIAPFVTSFRTPSHWTVDVTHFRPWLSDKVKFFIEVQSDFSNNRGFMMSASLDFYHGTSRLQPYRIIPLWDGTARYGSAINPFQRFFSPKTVAIEPFAKAAHLYMTTTGHSPVGEFAPAKRTITFSPDIADQPSKIYRFENILWRSDNYLNPNRPQFGTWQFSRAGWAPGDIVRPWWLDLTPHLIAGKTAELNYLPSPFDFSIGPTDQRPDQESISQAMHIIRAYLILCRSDLELEPAPFLEVIGVEKNSNASRSGIREGDYIENYNGHPVRTIDELRLKIQKSAREGKPQISATLWRGPKKIELSLDPGRLGVLLAEE